MSRACLSIGLLFVWLGTGHALWAQTGPVFGSMQQETAEEMVSLCHLLSEPQINGQILVMPQDFGTGICWGAFASIGSVIYVKNNPTEDSPVFGICAPKRITRTQIIKIFLEYARRNPNWLNEDYVHVAILAIREAFPCGKPVRPR